MVVVVLILVSFRLPVCVAFTSGVAGDTFNNQNLTTCLTVVFVLVGCALVTVEALVGKLPIIVDEDVFESTEVTLGVGVRVWEVWHFGFLSDWLLVVTTLNPCMTNVNLM